MKQICKGVCDYITSDLLSLVCLNVMCDIKADIAIYPKNDL